MLRHALARAPSRLSAAARAVAALVVLASPAAHAADEVSPLAFGLPHEGRLLDRNDGPVEGVRGMTFALYRRPDGGDPAWTQVQNVEFSNGYYAVLLGNPADPEATPLTEELLSGGPLYLGITIFPDAELRPRLAVGVVPFAGRAVLADKVEGGTITNATITGGTIADSRLQGVEVQGGRLQDVAVEASRIDASDVYIAGEKVSANGVRRDGDVMTGPLTAPRLVATATEGPPLEVASRARVDNLNAELLDGHPSEAFVLKTEFDPSNLLAREELYAHDFTNRVNGGAMENWLAGGNAAPNWWRTVSRGALGFGFVQRKEGWEGFGVTLIDNDPAGRVVIAQTVVTTPGPAHADADFTLSVRLRLDAGAGQAELCVRDTDLSRTCQLVDAAATWSVASVTHHTSAAPELLEISLSSTADDAQSAEVVFDDVILVRGRVAVPFRPSPTDHTPSGLVAYFPGTCPTGWVEYEAGRGRTIVGAAPSGTVEGTVGTALSDRGLRTLADVPAHAHEVDPPSVLAAATPDHTHIVDAPSQSSAEAGRHTHVIDPLPTPTANDGAHLHTVDPPAFNTTPDGDHGHRIKTYADGGTVGLPAWGRGTNGGYTDRVGTEVGGRHSHVVDLGVFDTRNGGTHSHQVDIRPFASGTEGDHAHVVNLAPFTSAGGGAHNHAVDVPNFSSASTGAPEVDVTMPYVQLTVCRSL